MDVKFNKFGIVAAPLLLASLAFGSASTTKEQPANSVAKAPKSSHHAVHHASKRTRKTRARGQKAIDGDRVREIQEALIREHYLKGDPSGQWDASTQLAMRHYQADQGWQSKSIPDSRALIRMGLGPDHEHLLNPDSAMTMNSVPPTARVTSRSNAKASAPASTAAGSSMPSSSTQVSAPSTMSAVPTR
jgi:peptidoglycan hydrolase-like protein with peptidoglycan-binding domain